MKVMKINFSNKIFGRFVCAIALLWLFIPLEINACGHCRYDIAGGNRCNFNFTKAGNGSPKECNGSRVGYEVVWKLQTCCVGCTQGETYNPCCYCYDCSVDPLTCNPWQVADTNTTATDYGYCRCEKECLDSPHESLQNPYYYDDPTNKANKPRQNKDRINLPVVLAWDDILGWKNDGTDKHVGVGMPPNIDYGPKSYRVEIIYEEYPETKDANLHIDKNKNPQDLDATTVPGKTIFYKIITKSGVEGFNSRDDGGACFFQTNSTYQWRVRPCCDEKGDFCKDYKPDEGWWTFSTSPAPELLGLVDNDKHKTGATDEIAQDPDWNGPGAMEDVDFCSAKLYWCKSKLVAPPEGNKKYYRFDKVYNDNQIPYAANYQMRVKSSENTSLGGLIEKIFSAASSAVSQTYSFLGIDDLVKKYLSSAPVSQCNQWMNPHLEKTNKSEAATGQIAGESESCHYLQRNADGTCAKAETLSFSPYINEINNNPSFKPFFSAAEKTSTDRNLFTGDWEGKLKYSWQIKVCFNSNPGQKDDDFPHCNSNIEEDYGQKWQLIGKKMDSGTIGKPALTSPADNAGWTKENDLVGANNTLNWTAPCGANSFLYDIQDENGESIFKIGDCATDYGKDGGRRIDKSQIIIAITDKQPSQGQDPGTVQLKIDTKYKWRVKSCWPSIPVGDIEKICSDQWSDWWSFRTTGRPPKIGSDAIKMVAPTATLIWESVSGAGSYRLKIIGDGAPIDEIIVAANQYDFNYPGAKKNYSWRVKTCADSSGMICGLWQAGPSFNSEDFPAPTNLSPGGEIAQLPISLSWNSSAKYFWVTAQVSDGEKSTSCDPEWFNKEYTGKIISATDMAIKAAEKNASPYCAGNYSFTVTPCFDDKCTSRGTNEARQTFFVIAKEGGSGLMVCGQATNNPKTPYNEKEPCEIRHLVLTTKIIVDFVIFKLAFLLLPVMLMITGAMFYLSHDKANLIPTLKDSWKKIGIGYGILFFAWIIVSILMIFAGYGGLWNQIL